VLEQTHDEQEIIARIAALDIGKAEKLEAYSQDATELGPEVGLHTDDGQAIGSECRHGA